MIINSFVRLIAASLLLFVGVANSGFALQKNSSFFLEADLEAEKQRAIELSHQWNRDSIQTAFDIFLQISQRFEKQGDKKNSALSLRKASGLCVILGTVADGIPLLKKSLRLEREIKNINGEAETLILLSYFNSIIGNFAESESYLTSSMNLYDRVDDVNTQATISYYAGEVFFSREDIPKFIAFFTQALELFRKSEDKRGEAQVLFSLSYASIANDNLAEGLRFAKESFALWNTLGEKRGEVLALSQIGLSQFRLGQTKDALNSLRQAEQMFVSNVDKTERAILTYNIGRIYESFSDCRQGINYYKNSLDLLNEEKNLSYLVGNLWTLGAITHRCGDNEQSLNYLSQSLELAKKLDKKADIIHTYIELGKIYAADGKYEQSKNNFLLAARMLETTPYKMNSAKAFDGLAKLYEKNGEISSARENYVSALSFYRAIKDDFSIADTLYNLARLDNLENKTASSIQLIEESIQITENLSADVFNSKLESAYFSSVFDRYELYINLLMKRHKQAPQENYAVLALQAAEKSRARSMLETLSLSEADFTKDADAETVRREKEIRVLLNKKADKLTDLLSGSSTDKSEIDKISGEINELENELEEIKARLKQSSPIYSAIKNPAPFDVGEFQNKILDENSLLLEFSFGAEESYLWLVGKNEIDSYVLAPRAQIESHIETLRALLAPRDIKQGEDAEAYQKRLKDSESAYEREAMALSEKLFGQIAEKLSGKRLIIVPDGKLHYFPVSALPLPNAGNSAPILLTNEIVYEPSAQTLELLKKSRNNSPAGKKFLVFSDPVFSSDDARLSGENKTSENAAVETASTGKLRFAESLNSLPRLPASKAEADSIIEIIGGAPEDSFSGFEANREQLLNAKTSDYKIIHFATHGLVNEQRPELSGIVLSRFDKNRQQIDESFRLHDIYGLNLNADLVVLSACNTAVGKEVKGEGLMSLNNAFLQVGAKSVVSSLWKVDDDAAKELMKDFYQGLITEKLTTSEALRQAQLKLSQNPQYKSPFFWAAFTLQGEFENKPQISTGFGHWIYFLLIIPFLGFGIYRFGKGRLFNRKIVSRR